MKSLLILLIIFLTTTSCEKKGDEAKILLRECVNGRLNETVVTTRGGGSFDFYRFSEDLENVLLENSIIDSKHKDSYEKMLIDLDMTRYPAGETAIKQIEKLIEENRFDFTSFMVRDNIFNQCPFEVYSQLGLEKDHIIYQELKSLKPLMDQGYYDHELISELFQDIPEKEFQNIIYRAPIIYLATINLDLKYNRNPDNPRKIDPTKIIGNY